MYLSKDQGRGLSLGVFMVGFGILFLTGYWWPGLMFLIGVTAIVQAFVEGYGRNALLAGIWPILFGCWDLLHYSVAAMFLGIGFGWIASVFLNRWFHAKPAVDDSLE